MTKKNNAEMVTDCNDVARFRNGILWGAVSIGFFAGVSLMLFHKMAAAKGIFLGTGFSIINFIVMDFFIFSPLGHSRMTANLKALQSIVIRYVILAIPVVVAIKSSAFNLPAVVVGIFSVQITILLYFVVLRPLLVDRGHNDG